MLEIASGSGEHAVFFSGELPHVKWRPSDLDPEALASIRAHRDEAGAANVEEPIRIDVLRDEWGAPDIDAMVCINMIHIAPWSATTGLFRGASSILPQASPLYLYGPYRIGGRHTAPSNEAFDASLRERNPEWGVRDLGEVTRVAESFGFARSEVIPMPANNQSVIFLKK